MVSAREGALVLTVTVNGPGDLEMTDEEGIKRYSIIPGDLPFKKMRTVLDSLGTAVYVLKKKYISGHSRWTAHQTEATDDADEVFTIRKRHGIQRGTDLILKVSKTGNASDYELTGEWASKNVYLYKIDENGLKTAVALFERMQSSEPLNLQEKFVVRIKPGVDHALVVALIGIADARKSSRSSISLAQVAMHVGTVGLIQGVGLAFGF